MDSYAKLIRLSKVAREFNVGISVIVEFLHKKGFDLDPNPNDKIPQGAYDLLRNEFGINIASSSYVSNVTDIGNVNEEKKPDIHIVGKISLKDLHTSRTEKPKQEKYNKHVHGSKRFDYFKPITVLGTLKFFDYRVNKFGFIIDVKGTNEMQVEKVHVSESGLATQKQLPDGEKVIFTLNKGNRGFYATNVREFAAITLEKLEDFIELLGIEEIVEVIRNSFRHDYYRTYYDNITPEDKESIKNLLFKTKDIRFWKLLVDISDNILIEGYIESIKPITESEKNDFIKTSYHITLLKDILSGWTTNDKLTILSLVDTLKNKQIQEISVPKNFVDNVKNIEWDFDEIWKIYSCFEIPELKDEVLQYFSFKNYDSIERLKSIAESSEISVKIKGKIQENLINEIDDISASSLIEIFINLKEYQIISDENHLLKLLGSKNLNKSNIEELISILSQYCSNEDFQKVIYNSIRNIRDWEILEILNKCKNKINIEKVVVDAYCSLNEPNKTPDYLKLLRHYKEVDNSELLNYILDKFSSKLSEEHPFEVFELAMFAGNIEVQKLTYKKLTFKSEDEIERFIEKVLKSKISPEVKACNKPLSGFINLIQSNSNFKLSQDCQRFLQDNKGKIQSHVIKFLVYQHYKGKITKQELKEIINSFQWTEISAILIIAFIQETNYTEKFLLKELDMVYKKHYIILNEQEFDRQTFFENFSINNFLNKCDGRKYYSMKKWEKSGISRWYMESDVLHESWDDYDSHDFYCEGRPWKRENIWDAQTNKPITKKIDFYWCRNKSCAGRNDKADLTQKYYHWTLAEITEALKIPVEKNVLANLAGWVNRINRILSHLFCRNCNEILRPLPYNPTLLGYYAVPVFQCINTNCREYGKKVRLTHCLNGRCESHSKNEPLDSRDCESCRPNDPNHTGLKCNYCGQSCPACSGYQATQVQETW